MVGSSLSGGRFTGWTRLAGDIGLAGVVMTALCMMVLPLPSWLLDGLIALNLTTSLLLLCFALFVSNPLSFTVFPTLLLVVTFFRLALNICSTRLILLNGDAGRIIDAFGGVVVGGDILVGAVVFGILAMVLFLVITKGAERVAEVAARFSLDALPGMQMAIDAELRMGALSAGEAARKRALLDLESRYFGALDGAMKLVRGDAVAALVIVAVNIVGGILVGTIRHGLSIGAAVDAYGRLTIGDGLASMIPAVLVSTASGLLVTRMGARDGGRGLAEHICRQLSAEPAALAATSLLAIGLSLVQGLPAWPFLILASGLGILAVRLFARQRSTAPAALAVDGEETALAGPGRLEMGRAAYGELMAEIGGVSGRRELSRLMARELRRRHGVPVSSIPIVRSEDLDGREMRLRIRGAVALACRVPEACLFSPAPRDALRGIDGVCLDVGGMGGWVPATKAAALAALGLPALSLSGGVARLVLVQLHRSVSRLLGLDDVQRLLDRIARERPVLVRETVPKRISLPMLCAVLGRLSADGVHLDLLPEVLEVVARSSLPIKRDDIVETIRAGLAPAITAAVGGLGDIVDIIVLGDGVASVLESGLVAGEHGPTLALAEPETALITAALRDAFEGRMGVALVTAPHLRRVVSDLTTAVLPGVHVLKTSELDPYRRTRIVGEVRPKADRGHNSMI